MNLPDLDATPLRYRLLGISALEVFFGLSAGLCATVEAEADLADLARYFEHIRYPGLPAWDALIPRGERDVLVRTDAGSNGHDHPLLQFSWDPARRAFHDPHDLYPLLKEARLRLRNGGSVPGVLEPVPVPGLMPLEAALLCARFPFIPEGTIDAWIPDTVLPPEFHRLLLSGILTGSYASRGLEILMESGYIPAVLPELALMDETDHSKEGHPEGNVWRHTVETLDYRKTADLRTSLALLLHDSGKPFADTRGERRFNRHAEIGAEMAGKILRRVGFPETVIQDVRWLIRFHMIPGALDILPDHRRDPVMASPLFPLLLEVYRCDLSSTYRGPEGYYRACRVYRRYLKRHRSSGSWARQDEEHRKKLKLYVD
ncbi:MAG: HD domain-containing protein [Spirochaetaceae bacterium]|nr:MAG: HD domain-containing protein [Spirochaetaceae bacterium]